MRNAYLLLLCMGLSSIIEPPESDFDTILEDVATSPADMDTMTVYSESIGIFFPISNMNNLN